MENIFLYIQHIDFLILDFIKAYLTNPFFDEIMPFITHLGSAGAIWIVLTVLFLISKNYRKTGIAMAISLIVCFIICNLTLKPVIARIRPFDINTVKLLIEKPTDFSFPSGHTASSFAAAIPVFVLCSKKKGIPALILASLISFSRLYLYVHFPTDVVFSILLATAVSLTVCKITKKNKIV